MQIKAPRSALRRYPRSCLFRTLSLHDFFLMLHIKFNTFESGYTILFLKSTNCFYPAFVVRTYKPSRIYDNPGKELQT